MEAVMWSPELMWFGSQVAERDQEEVCAGVMSGCMDLFTLHCPGRGGGTVSNWTFVENISQLTPRLLVLI